MLLSGTAAYAQPAQYYTFSAFAGTYSQVFTNPTNILADDQTQTGIPLGFTFNFAGANYSTVAMCSNGFMSLTNNPSNSNTNSAANAGTIGPMLMPLWDDLSGSSGTPSPTSYYSTTGIAPNRVFTLDCHAWRWNYTGTTNAISFEIKLYETTNNIDYIYEQEAQAITSPSATIGIFNTGTDFQTLPDATTNPIPSNSTFTTTIATKPATGQVYEWTPKMILCTTPLNNYCGNTTVNVSYTAYALTFNAGNTFTAQLSDATGSFATPTNIGSLISTASSGTIVCTIPLAQAAGTGYRIRVVSSNTAFTGIPNTNGALTINPQLTPSVTISANPGNNICAGTSVTFTAAITNGGPSPTYQWKVNNVNVATTATYTSTTLNNNDQVTCVITSNAPCVVPSTATSNTIVMTVNPNVTPTINITANPGTTICVGQSVTFTAAITNGGPGPVYQWKVNGFPVGTNTNTYTTTTLVNGDQVTCTITGNAPCTINPTQVSNTLTMTVNPNVTPTINITANPGNTACAGASVTFTANTTNAGPTPTYQWKVNGNPVGGNTATYTTTTLVNGDVVTCQLTSNATCANPATVTGSMTMTIIPNVTPTINVTANPGNTICAGTSVTFTAAITNGGPAPTYQWYVNGNPVGNNASTYTTTSLVNGDVVTCTMTSNASCAVPPSVTSSPITMTVNPVLVPTISLSANPGNTICSGTSVTFTASTTNGGPTPGYQWYLNGNPVGTNISTYTNNALQNGDVITCQLTSNALCAAPVQVTSAAMTMIVYTSITPSASISNNTGNTICSGTVVTFSAAPVNGGPTPTYQWFRNGNPVGTNSATYIDNTLANGDIISVNMTSNAPCATPATVSSNTIVMTVIPTVLPSAVISANPGNNICSGTTVNFTAVVTNGGPTVTYQWKKNGNNVGGNIPTYAAANLSNTDLITCMITSTAQCATPATVYSNNIVMNVTQVVVPDITITASPTNKICANTPVTFTAVINNGGPTPTYAWTVNGNPTGPNGPSFTTTTLNNNDVVNCSLVSNALCATPANATSNDITMIVQPVTVPSVTIAPNGPDSICDGDTLIFTASAVNGGPNPVFHWSKNGYPVGLPTDTYTLTNAYNNDVISCVMVSDDLCPSKPTDSSNSVTVTVQHYITPEVFLFGTPVICTGNPLTLSAIPYNPGPNDTYKWMLNGVQNGTGLTWTGTNLLEGDIVYCVEVSSAMCVTKPTDTTNIDTVHWFNAGYLAGNVNSVETNNVIMTPAPSVISYTDCDLISTVIPSGNTPVSGGLQASVTLDPTINNYLGQPYLQRHYDIMPATNGSGATAIVKLYAYQYEFDAYDSFLVQTNSILPPLPANHIDNGTVVITEFHGTGTTPGNYSGSEEIIYPTVNWDTASNWWVMTFPVKGFGGFYIHTTNAVFPLGVTKVNSEGFAINAYPNPAQDRITVQIDGTRSGKSQLYITDLAGRQLMSAPMESNKAIIDMSSLASGIYMLRYSDEERNETIKITKQ
jgi:hypothetical protein